MKLILFIITLFISNAFHSQSAVKNQYKKLTTAGDEKLLINDLSRARKLYDRAYRLKIKDSLNQYDNYASIQIFKIDSIIHNQDSILFHQLKTEHKDTKNDVSFFSNLPFYNYQLTIKKNNVSKEIKYDINDSVAFFRIYPNGLYKYYDLNGNITLANSHNSIEEFVVKYIYDSTGKMLEWQHIDKNNNISKYHHTIPKSESTFDFNYQDTIITSEQKIIQNINYKTKDTASTDYYVFQDELLVSVSIITHHSSNKRPIANTLKFYYNENNTLNYYSNEIIYKDQIKFDTYNYSPEGLLIKEQFITTKNEKISNSEYEYLYEYNKN
jgi:hypothetical protein